MVRNALVVVQDIHQDKAQLDGAAAFLQTAHVIVLDGIGQAVDDLFQRFYLCGQCQIVVDISGGADSQDLANGRRHNRQLCGSFIREGDALLVGFFCSLHQVYSVVAHTLKVVDGVQHAGNSAAVSLGQGLRGQLHQIGAQLVFVIVQLVLVLQHFAHNALIIAIQQRDGRQNGLVGQCSHGRSVVVALLNGNGGRAQQTLVQQHDLLLVLLLVGGLVLYQHFCQSDDPLAEGHQQDGDDHVKDGMDQCDGPGRHGNGQERQLKEGVGQAVYHHDKAGTEDIHRQVDAGNALCVGVGADAGDHRSDTGTDILTHNDGSGNAVGDHAGGRQCLQNGNRCGRTLDQSGEQSTYHNTNNGVVEADHHIGKLGQVGQSFHGIFHKVHAVHQNGKAHKDGTDALFLITLGTHQHQNTDEGDDGGEVLGLHHLQNQIIAAQAGKAQDPGSKGGADVGAEDDADGLAKLHDAGVYQTNQHNGDGRRRLHRNGDGCAQHQADDGIGSCLFQQLFQLAAGHFFQIAGHDMHAVQEKDQTQNQPKNIDLS